MRWCFQRGQTGSQSDPKKYARSIVLPVSRGKINYSLCHEKGQNEKKEKREKKEAVGLKNASPCSFRRTEKKQALSIDFTFYVCA